MVEKGKGKGGSIKLVLAPEVIEATPEGAEEAAAEVAELYAEEATLYPPVREVIENGWAKNRNIKPDVVETTARQGKTPTGGPWTRPDVVSVAVQQFTHLPGKFIEVVTFEIKPSNNVTVLAVYEALAQRRSATHAYAALHVPPDDESRLAEDIDRVLTAARAHGIGVIIAGDPANYDTWDEREVAERVEPDPADLDQFISVQLGGREVIRDAVR